MADFVIPHKLIDSESLLFFTNALSDSDPRLKYLLCWMKFLSTVVEISSDSKGISFESTSVEAVRSLSIFALPFRYTSLNSLFLAETDPLRTHILVNFTFRELSGFFIRMFSCASFRD